jgi:hypothetical protein
MLVSSAGGRELVLLEPGGSRRLELPPFREARFAKPDLLLLVLEAGQPEDSVPSATQLALHDLATGATRRFGPAGQHYDPEPSPDGRFVAVGSERPEIGDADLEIWSIEGEPEAVALRAQPLEEPRWRGDGQALAVAQLREDPESDDDTGGGFGLSSLAWPRLQRLTPELRQSVQIEMRPPGQLAPADPAACGTRAGSSRQSGGSCAATRNGGCTRVYAPGVRAPHRRRSPRRRARPGPHRRGERRFDRRRPMDRDRPRQRRCALLARAAGRPDRGPRLKGPTQRYVEPAAPGRRTSTAPRPGHSGR